MTAPLLPGFVAQVEQCSPLRWRGKVTQVVGQLIESEGPYSTIGEACEIVDSAGRRWPGEIVGFRGHTVLSMALRRPTGIRYGDQVVVLGRRPSLRLGEELLGRVLDGAGDPIDSGPNPGSRERGVLDREAPLALARTPIRELLGCGIRAVDSLRRERVPVLVIMCTNRAEALDPAITRRAAHIFSFCRPNEQQRIQVLIEALEGTDIETRRIEEAAHSLGPTETRPCGATYSDLRQRFLPDLVLAAYANDSPITAEALAVAATAFTPTRPFGTPDG